MHTEYSLQRPFTNTHNLIHPFLFSLLLEIWREDHTQLMHLVCDGLSMPTHTYTYTWIIFRRLNLNSPSLHSHASKPRVDIFTFRCTVPLRQSGRPSMTQTDGKNETDRETRIVYPLLLSLMRF